MAGRIVMKRGDLFSTTKPIVAHGCNCSGAFGAGVAGQVARLFPEAKRAYLEKYESDGWFPGDVQVVATTTPHPAIRMVANLATQREYGPRHRDRDYVDYEGFASAVARLLDFADDVQRSASTMLRNLDSSAGVDVGVAMPRIGCGLGGGDWTRIERILCDQVRIRDVEVEVWTP